MTFAGNTTAIVELNSQHGVDGSVARSAIPEGYCEEMENADISTAGVTKKRSGYQQVGQRLNNRMTRISSDPFLGVNYPSVHAYTYVKTGDTASMEAYSPAFTPSTLIAADPNCVTLRFRDSSGNVITNISVNTIFEVAILAVGVPDPLLDPSTSEVIGAKKFTFCPLDVVDGYVRVSSGLYAYIQPHLAGLPVLGGLTTTASTSLVPVGMCTGPSMYRLDHTNISSISLVSSALGVNTYDLTVIDTFPAIGVTGRHYFDAHAYYGEAMKPYTWPTPTQMRVTTTATYADGPAPRTLGFYLAPELYTTSGGLPVFRFMSSNSAFIKGLTAQSIWRGNQFLGTSQAIDGIDSYYSLVAEEASLAAISEGSLHSLLPEPAFLTGPVVGVYIQKPGSGAYTVPKTGIDSYVLSACLVKSYNTPTTIAAGDTFHYARYSSGVYIETPLGIVSAVNALGFWTITVKWDTEEYGPSPAALDLVLSNPYSTTQKDLTSLQSGGPSSTSFSLGDQLEFQDSQGGTITRTALGGNTSGFIQLAAPAVQTYPMKVRLASAWNPLPACKEWRDGTVQAYPIYLRTRGGSTASVATSMPFQSSLIVSSIDDPCMRYDGDTMFSMAFFRPQVMTHRSVPGSKGFLPIEQGAGNAKIGAKVEVAFTYSYTDKYGRTLESEPALYADGIAYPKAAADGSDVAEVLEFSLAPLPQGCMLPYDDAVTSRRMQLNTYIRTATLSQDGKYDYLLYKQQDASFLYVQTVLVGDKSTDFLGGTRLEYTELPNTPAPAVKYLTQAANHLVGLGSRTYPYMKISCPAVYDAEGAVLQQFYFTFTNVLGSKLRTNAYLASAPAQAIPASAGSPEYVPDPSPYLIPPTMNNSVVYCLIGGAAADRIEIKYSDWSHTFAGTFITMPTVGSNYKLRLVGGKHSLPLDIDLTGSNFDYATLPAPVSANRFVGKSKWLGTIDSGVPQAIAGKSYCLFKRLPSVVKGTDIAKSTWIASTKDNELRYYTLRTSGSLLTAGKFYLFDGLGTTGNIQLSGGDTQLLSWDSDLILKAGAQQDDGSATSTYVYFVLTPQWLKQDNTFSDLSTKVNLEMFPTDQPRFEVYELNDATVANSVSSALNGFTNPSTTATINAPRVSDVFPNPGGLDVGAYALLEPANAEAERFYVDYPAFRGAVKITGVAGDTITVTVAPSANILTRISDTISLVSPFSRLFNLRTMFPAGKLPSAAPANANAHATFFQFRGYDYNSTALQISGYFEVTSCDGTWATIKNPPVVDHRLISGLALSYSIPRSAVWGDYFPVPGSRGLAETLKDLALPMFSPNGSITDSPYVQVLKRAGLAMNTLYGNHCHVAYSSMTGIDINVAANEIAVFQPQKEYIKPDSRLATISTTSSPTSLQLLFTGYDPAVAVSRVVTNAVASTGIQFYQDDYPNRFYWTRAPGSNVVSAEIQAFRRQFYYDLITEDDSPITGATAFNDSLLIFKKDSIWRVTFNQDDTINAPVRVQSPVGSFSHHNLPATLDTCYFLHTSGVYTLDSQGVNNVFKLSRLFDKNVNADPGLLSLTAGYVDYQRKIVHVGTPYSSQFSSAIAPVDGQFAYSYNDGVLGWTVNTHIDALKFVRHNAETYFASSRGCIYKMSSGTDLEKYRDGDEPIPFAMKTRYTNSGENSRFKMYRQFLFQYGGDSKFDMAVYYSTDYKTTVTPLETYTLDNQTTEGNRITYGNGRFLKTLRESFGYRVNNISFIFTDSSYDSDCAIYSVSLEGILVGDKLVDQQRTPGNLKSQKRSRT